MDVDDDPVNIASLLWLFLLEFGCVMVMTLEPGYLDFDNLPDTNFSCVGKVIGGYYADLETNCQMFHVCTIGQLDEPMDIRFLCLNGTVFDQETRVCERIDEVDCSKSEQFYSLNLELYGNTQPPILEEDIPVEVKRSSTTTTTTTTTTQRPSRPKSTSQPYYTTSVPPTTTRGATKVITSHHFPVVNSPDIRFNPEEINISLNPGSPPDITRSQVPISFHQQSYSNSERNTRVTVTTHTTIYKNEKPHRVPLLPTSQPSNQILVEHQHLENPNLAQTTQTPKSEVSYGLTHSQRSHPATPTEINYGFTYQQTEESVDYNTEIPPHPYQYQLSIANLRPPTAHAHPYHSGYHSSSKRPHKVNYPVPTTYRNHPAYSSSAKASSPEEFHSQRTEKPPRLQLPLPLLPTLPPLTFSSPAPFSLGRHIETKRYTSDHHSPPRIIISASASVSDNSGRRLNYSLGQIGATHILGQSPASYDDYKEGDVSLDPFYHDVPKITSLRHKRSVREEDVIKNEQEAADLLRFLFNWYSKREKTTKISIPVASEDITEINEKLAPIGNIESSTSVEEDYINVFDKISTANVTESNTLKLEEANEVQNETDFQLVELLAKKLEVLNKKESSNSNLDKARKARTDDKEKTVNKVNHKTGNNTLLPEDDLNKNEQPTTKSLLQKSKRGRNHRRRPKNSRTTTRRINKPKQQLKPAHEQSVPSNSTHDSSKDELLKSKDQLNISFTSPLRKTKEVPSNKVQPRNNINLQETFENPQNLNVNKSSDKETKIINREAVTDDTKSSKNLQSSDYKVEQGLVDGVLANTDKSENKEDRQERVLTSKIKNRKAKLKTGHQRNDKVNNSAVNFESVVSEDIVRLPELLNYSTPLFDSSNMEFENYNFSGEEQVETHESNHHEHIITPHEHVENLPVEDQTEMYQDDQTTEFINLEAEDNEVTTTNFPEYIATTIQPEHEDRDVLSSFSNKEQKQIYSSENGEYYNDPSFYEEQIQDYSLENAEGKENSKVNNQYKDNKPPQQIDLEDNLEYDELTKRSDYEFMENESEPHGSTKLDNINLSVHEDNKNKSQSNTENVKEDTINETLYYETESYNNLKSNTENLKEQHQYDYENYENESEPYTSTESNPELATKENQDLNGFTTDHELNEVTFHIDLLNTQDNSETEHYSEDNTESNIQPIDAHENHENIDQFNTSKSFESDIATSQPNTEYPSEMQTTEALNRKNEKNVSYVDNTSHKKRIMFTPHHSRYKLDQEVSFDNQNKSDIQDKLKEAKNRIGTRGRNNFKTASRRTIDVTSDEEEILSNTKLNARNRYITNNHVRNRKFIATPSRSSKNIANLEIKENKKSQFNDKNVASPSFPDYVDDNYEPLTYQEPSEVKEPEKTINLVEPNLDEDTVTNEVQYSTDFYVIPVSQEHTSPNPTDKNSNVQHLNITKKENEDHVKINNDVATSTEATTEDDGHATVTDANYALPTETTATIDYLTTADYSQYTTEQETISPLITTQTFEITTQLTTPEIEHEIDHFETTEAQTTTKIDNLSTFDDIQTTNANTESTLDWAKFLFADYTTEETGNDETQATSVSPSSTTNSSKSFNSLSEPETEGDLTTPLDEIISTNKYQHLRTRVPWYKRQDNSKRKELARHRFNTINRRKGTREKIKIDTTTTQVLNSNESSSNSDNNTETLLVIKSNDDNTNKTAKLSDTEAIISYNVTNNNHNNLSLGLKHELDSTKANTTTKLNLIETTLAQEEQHTTIPTDLSNLKEIKEVPITDAPLIKSANPTKAKYTKIIFTTTPLTKFVRVELRKDMYGRRYTFNCFNKKVHQFYSDPRDCRLFHYCTSGYSKNQMVDMKFVCDSGTYFDDEKLICTKEKPARCL